MEGKKLRNILNFRTLLIVETMLCFVMALLLVSFTITGFSVTDSGSINAEKACVSFFILGIIGLAGLWYIRKK